MTIDKKTITKGIILTDESDLSKKLELSVDLNNSNKKVTLKTNPVTASNTTITLPSLTGTIATTDQVGTVSTNLSAHLSDTTDAHLASSIEFDPAFSGLTSTDVNNAILEVNARVPGSGSLVDTISTQTLENKTINVANNTIIGVVNTVNSLNGNINLIPNSKIKVSTSSNNIHSDALTSSLDSHNYSINTSIDGSGQLVITLKGANGLDLSSTNIAVIGMNNAQGNYTTVNLTSNLVLTIPANNYLGCSIGIPCLMWIYLSKALDNTIFLSVSINYHKQYVEEGVAILSPLAVNQTQSPSILYSNSSTSTISQRVVGKILFTKNSALTWGVSDITGIYAGDETLLTLKNYPIITKYLTATAGTIHSVSPGVTKLKIRLAGGGGGGGCSSPSGSSGGTLGTSGGNSTISYDPFGKNTTYITIATASGGTAGALNSSGSASGGAAAASFFTTLITGGRGQTIYNGGTATVAYVGGSGGSCGGSPTEVGGLDIHDAVNLGCGGAGTGWTSGTVGFAGTGGGGGGYVEIVTQPFFTSFKIVIGAGGTGQLAGAGVGSRRGGNGANGFCIVEEYFD